MRVDKKRWFNTHTHRQIGITWINIPTMFFGLDVGMVWSAFSVQPYVHWYFHCTRHSTISIWDDLRMVWIKQDLFDYNVAPPKLCLLVINPMNNIVVSIIKPSYWIYKPTWLSCGGPTLYLFICVFNSIHYTISYHIISDSPEVSWIVAIHFGFKLGWALCVPI